VCVDEHVGESPIFFLQGPQLQQLYLKVSTNQSR
jgi:hypothetical protein